MTWPGRRLVSGDSTIFTSAFACGVVGHVPTPEMFQVRRQSSIHPQTAQVGSEANVSFNSR